MYAKMICNYGRLGASRAYEVVSEGYDYFVVKCQGKRVYVPHGLVDLRESNFEQENSDEYFDFDN